MERPGTAEEIAALLAEGRRVRPVGGGTKLDWGALGPAPEIEISTCGPDDRMVILSHLNTIKGEVDAGELAALLAARK